ncbi:hypothetical protein [Planktothrix sp. FACHB-1365]|uniref:hypothetical protein n=1 Tax=Planktothrix sp. FACHB-1365 TaxID=2692855 RepID=UPI0016854583|nr:hypothetical protein [Planktothrix sp. FACHB-1365]MBD2485753.1 hypothetical protein [Planktothrix sp. FACHB-1365]
MNQHDLEDLKIPEPELEELSGISPGDVLICNLYRLKNWRDHKQIISIILNQILIVGLTLVFSLPLALIISRKTTYSSQDIHLFTQVFGITLTLSVLLTVSWNLYMITKTKPLTQLTSLLEEVNKYNDVIKAVEILDQLVAVGNLRGDIINRKEVIKALQITHDSLVSALKTERILREHQDFIGRRYELFANLENNLSALMALDVTNQASEYGRLLNETLEIGMSVHQEVRNLK